MRFNTISIQGKTCIVAGLFVLAATVSNVSVVNAQTTYEFSNRIERLENEIDTLNRAVYRGETPSVTVSSLDGGMDARTKADIEVRLQQFESEIRSLRGTVEEQGNRIYQMELQLERALSDMQMRMTDLENGNSSALTHRSNLGTSTPTENMSAGTEEPSLIDSPSTGGAAYGSENVPTRAKTLTDDQAAIDYENAFAQLKAGLYDTAGNQFMSFLEKYPDHVLAGNAKYWLGESFYVRGDYERAARVFAEGYKNYPQSSKTADNLLKLGLSLAAMDNKADACVALGQLKSDFAATPSPVTQRGEDEAKRLGCS